MKHEYPITPVSKPRMTRKDRWCKRKRTDDYWAYKAEVRLRKVYVPESGAHITFVLPMPRSWSKKKCLEMDGKPHQQRPDKDNLEKGLLDALFDEDCTVWDSRVTKIWGMTGKIIIET